MRRRRNVRLVRGVRLFDMPDVKTASHTVGTAEDCVDLKTVDRAALKDFVAEHGVPRYRGDQLFN